MKTLAESNDVVLPQNRFGAFRRFLGWLFMTDRYLASLSHTEIARKAGQPLAAHARQVGIFEAERTAQMAKVGAQARQIYVRRAQPEAAQ